MEKNEYQDIHIQALTPNIVLEYLQFKQAYEGKGFIDLWNNIVPRYFIPEEICRHINTLREKRIEVASRGKEESKKAFFTIFDEILRNKIKDKKIDHKEFKQLIGSLMSVYTSPKFKQFTQNYTKDIFSVLDQIHQEKNIEAEKRQEKIKRQQEKVNQANRKMEEKMEQENIINKDLFNKYTTAKQEFLDTKEI